MLVSVREVQVWQAVDIVSGAVVHRRRASSGSAATSASLDVARVRCRPGVRRGDALLLLARDRDRLRSGSCACGTCAELFEGIFQTGRWPVGIYPDWLRFGVTFLVPIAFAVTVPAEAVTSRLDWQTLSFAAVFAVVLLRRSRAGSGASASGTTRAPRRDASARRRPGTTASSRAGGRSSTSTARRSTASGRSSRPASPRSTPRAARAGCSCRICRQGSTSTARDISPDMLALVPRALPSARGSTPPNLYAQAMHELDLPRRYRTIIVCGGFGLGGQREHDVEGPAAALRAPRAGRHARPRQRGSVSPQLGLVEVLAEGGAQASCRGQYRDEGDRRVARGRHQSSSSARGSSTSIRSLNASTLEMRACMRRGRRARWRGGARLAMTLYFTHEIVLMLERRASSTSSSAPATTDRAADDATTTSSSSSRRSR